MTSLHMMANIRQGYHSTPTISMTKTALAKKMFLVRKSGNKGIMQQGAFNKTPSYIYIAFSQLNT